MTETRIEQGQTREIIPQDQAGKTYLLEVIGGLARVGHNERYAREGTRIKAGDRIKINPMGKPVYMHAEDADIRLILDHANSDIDYQSRAEIGDVSRIEVLNELQAAPSIEDKLDEMITLLETIGDVETSVDNVHTELTTQTPILEDIRDNTGA